MLANHAPLLVVEDRIGRIQLVGNGHQCKIGRQGRGSQYGNPALLKAELTANELAQNGVEQDLLVNDRTDRVKMNQRQGCVG